MKLFVLVRVFRAIRSATFSAPVIRFMSTIWRSFCVRLPSLVLLESYLRDVVCQIEKPKPNSHSETDEDSSASSNAHASTKSNAWWLSLA